MEEGLFWNATVCFTRLIWTWICLVWMVIQIWKGLAKGKRVSGELDTEHLERCLGLWITSPVTLWLWSESRWRLVLLNCNRRVPCWRNATRSTLWGTTESSQTEMRIGFASWVVVDGLDRDGVLSLRISTCIHPKWKSAEWEWIARDCELLLVWTVLPSQL